MSSNSAQVVDGVATAAGPALQVTGVRKTYESEGVPVRALRGVSMSMAAGEFVAVMGPSGCGKVDAVEPGGRVGHPK